jgi:anti-sigma factor RsiW
VRSLICREVVELVTAYLEGALSRRDRKRFERHIAACDGCTAYLAQMRVTIRTVGAITEDDLSPAAKVELVAAFRTWKAGRPA